jgi:hypothetical protein
MDGCDRKEVRSAGLIGNLSMASRNLVRADDAPQQETTPRPGLWRVIAAVEVMLAIAAVLLDLLIPSLILIVLAIVSLLVRRQGPGTLGLQRPARAVELSVEMLVLRARCGRD